MARREFRLSGSNLPDRLPDERSFFVAPGVRAEGEEWVGEDEPHFGITRASLQADVDPLEQAVRDNECRVRRTLILNNIRTSGQSLSADGIQVIQFHSSGRTGEGSIV